MVIDLRAQRLRQQTLNTPCMGCITWPFMLAKVILYIEPGGSVSGGLASGLMVYMTLLALLLVCAFLSL